MSIAGIAYLCRMGAALLFLAGFILGTYHLIKNRKDVHLYPFGMFLCIIAVNAIVLLLTYTTYGAQTYEYRYHLIPIICGYFIVGYELEHSTLLHTAKHYAKNFCVLLSVAFCIIFIGANIFSFRDCYNTRSSYTQCNEIIQLLKTDRKTIAYYIDEDITGIVDARTARLIDPSITVISGKSYGSFEGWGASTRYFDLKLVQTDSCAIIITPNAYEKLNPSIKKQLSFVRTLGQYQIYYQ